MTSSGFSSVVRLDRTIPAPPHDVYRAWLEPDMLRRWLAPAGLEVTRAEVDERENGHFRVWQANQGEDVGGFDCQLAELVPDRRIVFRWGFVGPERRDDPEYDSLLTITLHDAPEGGTKLELVHERLDKLAERMPYAAENVGAGWGQALQKLIAVLS